MYWQFIFCVFFLVAIYLMPKGFWKTRAYLNSRKDKGKEIDELKSNVIISELNEIRKLILEKDSNEINTKLVREKLFKSIDYAIKRHDWYENQRSRVFQVILWINGFALTFIGLALRNNAEKITDNFSLLTILVTIIISVMTALFLYNYELDSDRPYRSISDIRHWFFRYNLPNQSGILKKNQDKAEVSQAVIEERKIFFERLLENFSFENSIREDIEQIFILHVLQRYKNESLSRLRWLMTYTTIFILLEVLLSIIL